MQHKKISRREFIQNLIGFHKKTGASRLFKMYLMDVCGVESFVLFYINEDGSLRPMYVIAHDGLDVMLQGQLGRAINRLGHLVGLKKLMDHITVSACKNVFLNDANCQAVIHHELKNNQLIIEPILYIVSEELMQQMDWPKWYKDYCEPQVYTEIVKQRKSKKKL